MVKRPGSSVENSASPRLLVSRDRTPPPEAACAVIVTWAPTITAPLGSTTVTCIIATDAACARASSTCIMLFHRKRIGLERRVHLHGGEGPLFICFAVDRSRDVVRQQHAVHRLVVVQEHADVD